MDELLGADSFCSEEIYDESVMDFLVRYDGDIQGAMEQLQPDCTNIISGRFLVAYKKINSQTTDEIFGYSYNVVPKCYGLLDTSAVDTMGVNPVQNLPGLSLYGKDVIIGFVDTGIDYLHPVFQRRSSNYVESRILAIWDQTEDAYNLSEGKKSVFGYGAEYRKQEIDKALIAEQPFGLVPSKDEDGHGTFLASVAGGGVYEDSDSYFTGVAPECDVLMVKLKPAKKLIRDYYMIEADAPCYSESDIMLGIKFLIEKAIEFGKPLVICLGVGTNQGSHSGTGNLEAYLDAIANLRGICVVVAGGNELGAAGHFRGSEKSTLLPRENVVELYVADAEKGFCVEVWGSAPRLLKVAVVSPTGQRFDRLPVNQKGFTYMIFLYEGTVIYAENILVEKNAGDPFVLLRFKNPAAGIWSIIINENETSSMEGVDLWLPMRQFVKPDTKFVTPDPSITLCSPANCRGCISVEGYNHYDKSLYVNGSRGYTRDGRVKPDLVAPAVNVFGAFPGNGNALFTRKSGSSVASALGAGTAALLLEWGLVRGNNRDLNTEMIRQMLIRGTRNVVDITYPNRAWGWGVLDIYETFESMRNIFS